MFIETSRLRSQAFESLHRIDHSLVQLVT
jgi:hypothetical protein